jgi:hypothetical protein
MESLVARYPQVLGIGIDESTALVVAGNEGEVAGRGAVYFYDAANTAAGKATSPQIVKPGGRYDLVERKVLDAGGAEEKAEAAAEATASSAE